MNLKYPSKVFNYRDSAKKYLTKYGKRYAPLLAAPLCITACYMSFTGYKLVLRDGAWPSGLLCAVAVWVFICIRVAFWDHRKARIGVHIFGMGKSEDLVHFIDDFDSWCEYSNGLPQSSHHARV